MVDNLASGPNSSNVHPPEYCQPTIHCQIQRLQLHNNICPEAQGLYEPVVCPAGSYCPAGGKEQYVCPSGSFCPLGSYEPWRCDALAYCPAGSIRQFRLLGLLIAVLLDIALALYIFRAPIIRAIRKYGESRHSEVLSDQSSLESQDLKKVQDWSNEDLSAFVQSVKRCVGTSELGLSFKFQDVSLVLPDSRKVLLNDINCTIGAGQLWGIMGASGAGKSTFVNVLTGKMTATSGKVLASGFNDTVVSYVDQYSPGF